MKTKILLWISLSVLLFQCSPDAETKSPVWGIDFSPESAIPLAQGAIDQQNSGNKVTYIVNSAYLRQTEDEDLYTIAFTFESGDAIQLTIAKETADYNYHFPGNEGENRLVSAFFNSNSLDLNESSIFIQPRQEENKMHIITNLFTLNAGDFKGTLTRVPLVK